ncbi:MAG TPA: NAD(P)/FAD-dependent oxidoreductase [Armatimonadota bacterium]|nr:NAD(P)/FAD-dependent oxidoreductase [Armatimonadota bacterium]
MRMSRVLIVGGGPSGCACALALRCGAQARGESVEVILLEPKRFGRHFNQCAGVVMPSQIDEVLGEWGTSLPRRLIQREVGGYVLHAEQDRIELPPRPGDPASSATRRVRLDQHLLNEAHRAGTLIVPDRASDIEIGDDGVVVYTDGDTYHADAVIGAFGLDPGTAGVFARCTRYRPPPALSTLVTKVHPHGLEPVPGLLGDQIHAFLPRLPGVEFGALIPKGNHVSIIVAGRRVTEADMRAFIASPRVRELLPSAASHGDCFRGAFPAGRARGIFSERCIIVGDAAGMVRPFKGGGIRAALLTGRAAGRALLEFGPCSQAGASYVAACGDLASDVAYGRLLRALVALLSGPFRLEAVIALARHSPELQRALYDCVSGRTSYRQVFREQLTPRLLSRIAWDCLTWPLRSRGPGR